MSIKTKSDLENSANGYRAEKAVMALVQNIESIRYVKHWAKEICMSKEWLKKQMNTVYGKLPKIILKEVRNEIIITLIKKEGWEASSYSIAVDSGVGVSSDALYKFLKRHYDITFSELKRKIQSGDLDRNLIWLKKSKHGIKNTSIDDIYTEIDD